MDETKVIYHIDDEETPYLVKIPLPSSQVTLKDFKMVLNKQTSNYKYFFKSMDADFGVVKEEIADDSVILPCFNGRVVSWLVTADGSNQSDNCSEIHRDDIDSQSRKGLNTNNGPTTSNLMQHQRQHQQSHMNHLTYQSASVMSSDLDSTSLFETESEITLDRDMTECSSIQRLQVRKKPQRRKKRAAPSMSRTSSYSSITDSSMSLNIITVSINMEAVNFLGISIVGQSNRGGDGGIYVGSIMKGGAVALDGRIEPGDMILQVNDVNFENMTNDEAVRVLREVVQKPGPIKLVVAKCWDPNPKGYFTIPRTEPVRPIDPGAWVAHTQAIAGMGHDQMMCPELSDTVSTQQSIHPRGQMVMQQRLTRDNLLEIVNAMVKPDSGLEIRDRMWLKITIPNAFIGADAVNWVLENVEGVNDRRDARRIVSSMLRNNLIKHTVNKMTFSEQCYYVLNDGRSAGSIGGGSGGSTISGMGGNCGETDSIISDIAPLPNPPIYVPYSGTYNPSHGYQPIQYGCTTATMNSDRRISSGGSSGSDVLTSKDISASQSDITSIIQRTTNMTLPNGSNKSSSSSNRGGDGAANMLNEQDSSVTSTCVHFI